MKNNYQFWDSKQLIDSFDKKNVSSFFKSEQLLLDKIELESLSDVLDVGCSCGRFHDLLRSKGYSGEFHGVDISAASIDICKRNYPSSSFYNGNYLDDEFRGQYDLINATGVVQHELQYRKLIHKMYLHSKRYVMFDVKLANVSCPVSDVNTCYCEVDGQRIPMIVFSFSHLVAMIKQIDENVGITMLGYQTAVNDSTRGPHELVDNWVSCGVLLDKVAAGNINIIEMPSFIKVSVDV